MAEVKNKTRMLTKKVINSVALVIGIFGVLLTFVFGFILFGVMDSTEKITLTQIDYIIISLGEAEESIGNMKVEANNTKITLVELAGAMDGFGTSLEGLAGFMDSFDTISQAIGFGSVMGDGTKESLLETAESFETLSENFVNHGETIEELGNNLEDLKENLKDQKQKLTVHKSSISKMFGDLKLGIILLVLILLSMFGVLLMVSVARLL